MKLSDKDLHYALWCAEKHTGNSLYAEAMADLEDGVLEIEGYERVEWTRFDPNDPKTFPPIDTTVLLTVQGRYDVICTWRTCANESQIAFGLPRPFTHWRPLPPPPGKEAK